MSTKNSDKTEKSQPKLGYDTSCNTQSFFHKIIYNDSERSKPLFVKLFLYQQKVSYTVIHLRMQVL